MRKTAAQSLVPPLAVDNQGNPLAVPDEAAAWRVRRHTGGRPRMVLGPDRQPLLLQLDTTADDLAEMLGPGSYRLDAVDADGEVLDCLVCVGVGDGGRQRALPASQPGAAMGGTRSSDLRAVLEANVQMAQSLADAVRVLSEAQADWTKGLASAKAIPRNAAPAKTPPAVPVSAIDDHDDEEDEDDDEIDEPTWYERLATSIPPQYLPGVVSAVGDLVDRFTQGSSAATTTAAVRNASSCYGSGRLDNHGDDHSDNHADDRVDNHGDNRKANHSDDGSEQVHTNAPFPMTPEVLAKIEAVKAQLAPGEIQLLTTVLATAGPQALSQVTQELMPLPVEEAVARLRTMMTNSETPGDK